MAVFSLTNAGGYPRLEKSYWIDDVAKGEREFLFTGERCGVGGIAAVEVWDDAENALFLGGIYLGCCDLLRRGGDGDAGVAALDSQRDLQICRRMGFGNR